MDWVGLYPQNMTFLCLLAMKRNLNLVATAASLILLGLPGESYALQNYQDSRVGSGLLSVDKLGEAKAPPLIVKSERKLISELKPLTMPKLKQLSGRPVSDAIAQTDAAQGSPAGARLPDAGMPVNYGRKPGAPPIIRSSSRRLSQADGAGLIPPVVQANGSGVQHPSQPPIIKSTSRRLSQAGIISPVVQPDATAQSAQTAAYYPQGSATRTPLPPIESSVPSPAGSSSRAFPQSAGSSSRSFPQSAGSSSRSFPESGAQSVVVQSPVAGGSPEYFSAGPSISEQPVFDDGGCATCAPVVSNDGACASCGTGMTDGVCPTCGPGAGYANGPVIEDFCTYGLISAARCYFHAEALVFTRADGDIAGPTVGALNDFDTGGGLRLTFGNKSDSINGRELGVFLLSGIEEDLTIVNSPFLVEDLQQQNKESDLYTIEYNRVNYGWDVVKTFVGLKYIRFDDSYRILSTDAFPANNSFASLDSVNNLFGAHLGGELFYDIGFRWSGSVKGSWGLYANFNDFDSTNGVADGPLLSTESTQGTVSTAAELNFLAHYQIRTDMRFQIGYNLIFVGNVASVADNLVQQVPTLNAVEVTDSDDVFFHGLSFGLEFYR